MEAIVLNASDGDQGQLWVNPEKIIKMYPVNHGSGIILHGYSTELFVTQSPQIVMDLVHASKESNSSS
jgi:hypothetical protein